MWRTSRSPNDASRFFATGLAATVAAFSALAIPVTHDGGIAMAQSARPWLGVEVNARKDGKPGVVVKHVIRTSPADAAGLKDGDFLLKLAGKAVSAPNDVVAAVRAHQPGDVIEAVFEHGGHEQRTTVTLATFPDPQELLRREKVGTFAPALSGVKAVQGSVPELSTLRGKVVILDFWAGWCGVCKLMTPVLNGWSAKFGPQGLVVIGVSSDDAQTAAKASWDFGVRYAVGSDANGAIFPAYGVSALPTMYVVDKKGVIRSVDVGFDGDGLVKTQSLIRALLAEQNPLPRRGSTIFVATPLGERHSRAVLRVLDELLWTLRRRGIAISPAQAIDVIRAIAIVGFEDREAVRDAIAAIVVERRDARRRFDALFDRFFSDDELHARDVFGRLRRRGFDEAALARLREILDAVAADGRDEASALLRVLLGGAPLDFVLVSAESRRALAGFSSGLQTGFFVQRMMQIAGVSAASKEMARLRVALTGALGVEVGGKLADALAVELEMARGEVRAFVERHLRGDGDEGAARRSPAETPFASLAVTEIEDVRRGVRILAERLRGAARVRERHRTHGRIDVAKTTRGAIRTGGVPFRPAHRRRLRDKPRLFLLCDVSDSVRTASVFLLEFVAVAQELFDRTRTFVFVSELGETTALFKENPLPRAMATIFRGEVVSLAHNSNYGRVLRQLEERYRNELDRRVTVVILGDGRTNHQPPEIEALMRIRERVRAVIWLCPEPRGLWGTGDSVMPRYASASTTVLVASTAAELERAARTLVQRR